MIDYINGLDLTWRILAWVAAAIIFIGVTWGLVALSHLYFRRMRAKRSELHLAFFERLTSAVIVIACIIIAVSAFSGAHSVWQTLLGGTAIISAVIAFAAQDVIKDILAGLMISVNRPFELGNRIVLEDGTAGIVEDMTMRHVVIRGVDTLRYVIPNSKINAMKIENLSYGRSDRSILLTYSVGYDTDIELAKKVIADAVSESPHTVPRTLGKDGELTYTPAYFLALADSALMISITAYYEKTSPTEVVKDDLNTRVRAALIENGIEIPYNHVTIVNKEKESE